jgi:hypothetical protein
LIKWIFAKNDGGRDSGFHDAGVETFKGNIDRYLARELIQNSLDARYDSQKPVQVKFELLPLKPSEIPDIKSLAVTFERCAEYWPTSKKAKAFFERALGLTKQKTILALKVSDYNTAGVVGSETDRKKDFYNLIRCAGASSKSGDEGGSFGIGKHAPFAASQMRTVFYSTYNKEKEHIFIGVAMLVSHQANGTTHQSTGYLGLKNGASVREKSEIPPQFLRTKMGTDIIVLGFPDDKSWQKDLIYSVLENFWPAIEFGDLVVTVGSEQIAATNLGDLLTRFSGEEGFSAHQYYKAFKEASMTFPDKLTHLRDVTLYLSSGETDLPKRVAMIRKPGMVVFTKRFQSVVPFCGVFICKNEIGNRLLRDMEPPRHDIWDPDHPEKAENKKIESEFVHFIRDSIRNLLPSDETNVILVPGLSRFLPDDDETPEDAFEGGEDQKSESESRSRLPEKIEGKKIDPRRTTTRPDHVAPGEGEEEGDGGGSQIPEGDGEGGGGGGGGSGDGEGGTGPGKGRPEGEQAKPTIPIRYRTFATNVDSGVYSLTVQSENKVPKGATLTVWTVGDQGKAPAEISSARQKDGKAVLVRGGGVLGPIVLPNKKGTLHLEFKLREPLRFAMEVAAHETE